MNTLLVSIHGKVTRKSFALWGLFLFAIKYNIDRAIAISDGESWFLTDYFQQPDHLSVSGLSPEGRNFYFILVAVSPPFIWLGATLCLKRLRDIQLPLWLVCLFFL